MEQKRKAGRPTVTGKRLQRVAVTLDDATIERGRALGNGSLSQGIRAALNPRPVAAPSLAPDALPADSAQPKP
jgi:hypothetical protein